MLEQILADPADDALRLVYADQLLAAGDVRGEYIAIEARMAETPRGSSERAALARRRGALRKEHGKRWWPRIPERRIGTRYGFAETIAVTPRELGRVARIAAREPISALELLEYRGEPLPADAPWQERIRRLAVHGDAHEPMSLLQGPLGEVVEELALWSHRVPSWPPFAHHLPRCRRLRLAGSSFADIPFRANGMPDWDLDPPAPLRALAGWDHLAGLEVLDLSYCEGTTPAVRALVTLELPALRVLRVSGGTLDDDGALELASGLHRLRALERVELVDTRISGAGAELLRSAGARAEIVLEAPAPSRLAIDALGIELELVRVGDVEWVVEIDGVPRPIRIRSGDRREMWEEIVESANLSELARAFLTGAVPALLPDGMWVRTEHGGVTLEIPPDRSELRYRS